jgi:hypothetical protein
MDENKCNKREDFLQKKLFESKINKKDRVEG